MDREPKKRKPLVLIGIVCDEEIKGLIDVKSAKDRTKMVRIFLCYHCHNFILC